MNVFEKFIEAIEELQLNKGERLLIASDVTKIIFQAAKAKEKIDLSQIIDLLQRFVSEEGTLLFPVYNWGFCTGDVFDYRYTQGLTGALSNTALKRPDFNRTMHPIYSFAVWGKDKNYLLSLKNKSSFGIDSPFAYLHKGQGKMLMIGVDYQSSFTFVHYVEECCRVHYRYMKDFQSAYIDNEGGGSQRTYSMFVRDLIMGVETDVNPIGRILEEKGISKCIEKMGVPFRIIDLEKAYSVISDDIMINGARNLYFLKS